jgi:hypothetical protein
MYHKLNSGQNVMLYYSDMSEERGERKMMLERKCKMRNKVKL